MAPSIECPTHLREWVEVQQKLNANIHEWMELQEEFNGIQIELNHRQAEGWAAGLPWVLLLTWVVAWLVHEHAKRCP